jgi:ribonuclease P protein component
MPKKNRLTGAEIRKARPTRRVSGALFSLSVSPGGAGVRFACVVSKKVSMKAVVRNLVKRRSRAAWLKVAGRVPAGVYLLHAKRESASALYADIEKDIKGLVGRLV